VSALLPIPNRDFAVAREFVWRSDRSSFVLRERQAMTGAHVYYAYERSHAPCRHSNELLLVTGDSFGRVDTLKPEQPISEYTDAVAWVMVQQRRAREVIRALCPETAPAEAVYDGPGYVTLLTRPESRYAGILAAKRPF